MTEQRFRLAADRFRRVWHIVEHIAAKPGLSRRELADFWHLSERQIQADLNLIRTDMRLPLVRDTGYRFDGQDVTSPAMTLADALLLSTLLGRADHPASMREGVGRLAERLPDLLPPHLRPLGSLLFGNLGHERRRVCVALVEAILGGTVVRLHYPRDVVAPFTDALPVVRARLLVPYLGDWYLIADWADGRARMIPLAAVESVSWVDRAAWPAALRHAS